MATGDMGAKTREELIWETVGTNNIQFLKYTLRENLYM